MEPLRNARFSRDVATAYVLISCFSPRGHCPSLGWAMHDGQPGPGLGERLSSFRTGKREISEKPQITNITLSKENRGQTATVCNHPGGLVGVSSSCPRGPHARHTDMMAFAAPATEQSPFLGHQSASQLKEQARSPSEMTFSEQLGRHHPERSK